MEIEMISTGEEVLTGFITDTNAVYLSQALLDINLKMTRRSTVGDNFKDLKNIFLERSQKPCIVIVNGGLGPTTDDLTRDAAAAATGTKCILINDWVNKLHAWAKERGLKLPDNNIRQAYIPEKASIIDNPYGTACGFYMHIGQADFIFTPGVPHEFKHMTDDFIIPYIKKFVPESSHIIVKRCFTFGIGESALGSILEKCCWPKSIDIGYRVSLPYIELKLCTTNATDVEIDSSFNLLKNKVQDWLIAENTMDFPASISSLLKDTKLIINDTETLGTLCNLAAQTGNLLSYTYGQTNFSADKNQGNNIYIQCSHNDNGSTAIIIQKNNTPTIVRNIFFKTSNLRRQLDISYAVLDILRRELSGKNTNLKYPGYPEDERKHN